MRTSLLALVLPLFACTHTETEETDWPALTTSTDLLELGEVEVGSTATATVSLTNDGGMDLGLGSIAIGDGETQLSVTVGEMACDGDVPADTTVLPPGCALSLDVTYAPAAGGDLWGALVVTTATDPDTADAALPAYSEDPVSGTQVVWLHGTAPLDVPGRILATPSSYDFGFVHPDGAADLAPARIALVNVGAGDATIDDVSLSSTCDPAFTLVTKPERGTTLMPSQSTLAEVAFGPSTTDPASCELDVVSDGETLAVTIAGNTGTDPENAAPTVLIASPGNGARVASGRPFEMELDVYDADQPPSTVACTVTSATTGDVVGDCTPDNDAGHVYVAVDPDLLPDGTDTLVVTATDGNGASATAAISVVGADGYPADDDDGDGYSALGTPADCDDGDPDVYPSAVEVLDGVDGDCDGVVDDETAAWDDDGDGYTEQAGDCDDTDADVSPGARERGNGLDDDCDAVIDDGTALGDDDGDGFSEVIGDCDDADAAIGPAAVELCGTGVDEDCDGLTDTADACTGGFTDPVVAGSVVGASQTACLPGDTIQLEVVATDADGDALTVTWSDDLGGTFSTTTGQSTEYTCPTPPEGGKNTWVYAVAEDDDGNTDFAAVQIAVFDASEPLYDPYVTAVEAKGCATTGGRVAGAWALAAAIAMGARRKG